MGFNLIGHYPVSQDGAYFRMNQFMWSPLGDLLHDICNRKILCKCHHWHSSDEDGLRLTEALAGEGWERRSRAHVVTFTSYQACAKKRGTRHAIDARDNLRAIEAGRKKAAVMARRREEGKVTEFSNIALTRELAERFAVFLKDCGGFKIC
jgi:hypothetical protein